MSRRPAGLTDLTLYPLFAEGIAEGRGYLSLGQHPTAYYPPGYPFFLGGLQWILDRVGLGEHLVLVAGLLQALLGGLAVGAVVVAGARLGGRRVALVAGVVLALWPNLIIHSSLMLSETLFIAVFTVTLAGAAPGARRPTLVVPGARGGRVRPGAVHADPARSRRSWHCRRSPSPGRCRAWAGAAGAHGWACSWRASCWSWRPGPSATRWCSTGSSWSRPTPATTSAWASTPTPPAGSWWRGTARPVSSTCRASTRSCDVTRRPVAWRSTGRRGTSASCPA